jgi:hypothetical protein
MRNFVFFTLLSIVFFSCSNQAKQRSESDEALEHVMQKMMHGEKQGSTIPQNRSHSNQVTVLEAIDAGTYTYLRLDENGKVFWAAINSRPIQIGQSYTYSDATMMLDFESKQLGRTFDTVMFIQHFDAAEGMQAGAFKKSDPHSHTKTRKQDQINVVTPGEGYTIEAVYDQGASLAGQRISVKGEVVKISQNIMKRHWIHIQDGTRSGNNYDLTITSTSPIDFKVGDVVSFSGILRVDKDFGSGYFYKAILEEAGWTADKTI